MCISLRTKQELVTLEPAFFKFFHSMSFVVDVSFSILFSDKFDIHGMAPQFEKIGTPWSRSTR